MNKYEVEIENGELHVFEAAGASVMPNGILALLDRDNEALVLFTSDQWLVVKKIVE